MFVCLFGQPLVLFLWNISGWVFGFSLKRKWCPPLLIFHKAVVRVRCNSGLPAFSVRRSPVSSREGPGGWACEPRPAPPSFQTQAPPLRCRQGVHAAHQHAGQGPERVAERAHQGLRGTRKRRGGSSALYFCRIAWRQVRLYVEDGRIWNVFPQTLSFFLLVLKRRYWNLYQRPC